MPEQEGFFERVVLDTSALIGAILLPQSVPRYAFMKALGSGTLCASPATLAELEQVLMREKFDRYLDRDSRLDFLQRYRHQVLMFPVTEAEEAGLPQACRDPRDNKFLALALHCSADVLVSSNDDLLVLNPWQGIPILTPAQFLK
ncbi:MAG: putative toxin-antitoxin system toxin component, PIN family [Sulfurimicrobium sp.]|jgi:putative PIN family toxin of toxin-antitoxin system|nr:putative toxin-antitoxin system toxin component, PIN family [Sulfurimicrobium sp.]